MLRLRTRLISATVALSTLAPALRAAGDAPLSYGVPANVHFFARGWSNPDRDAIDAQIWGACERLWDSGILWDFVDLAAADAPRARREKIRATVERVIDMLGKVSWGDLFRQEMVFAFRFNMPMPEYLVLCRVPEGEVERHLASLRGFLADVASLAPETLQVRERETDSGTHATLFAERAPIGLHVGNAGNAIVLCTSQPLFTTSLHLLREGTGEGSIARSPVFEEAIASLPKDREEEGLFDIGRLCHFLSGPLGVARTQARGEGGAFLEVAQALLSEFANLRTIAWTIKTTGNRMTEDVAIVFEPGSSNRFFPKLFGADRTLEGYERFVPKEAVACSASAGCDPVAAYDALYDAIEENTIEGEGLLAQWEAIQEQIGFDLRDDLLAWISGETLSISLPSEKPGLFGNTDCVWLVRVNEGAKLAAKIDGLLDHGKAFLESRGQSMRTEAVAEAPGLRVLRLDAFPNFRPVVGVREDMLVLASCPEAAAKVFATRAGGPNVLQNERFKGLRLGLDGPVGSLHYADVRGQLEGFAQILSALGFGASLVPRDRDTEPILKIGAILTKLGRFFREIDLEVDRGGFSKPLRNAEGVHYRTVSTFRRSI